MKLRCFSKSFSKSSGFTLVEIILVIVLFLAALGFSVLFAQTSQVRNDLRTQVATFVSYVRLAQSNALSGKNGSFRAIHLDPDSYTLFNEDIFDPVSSTNFEIELPETIQIMNINLNLGSQNIIFVEPQGTTETYGTLDFISNQINRSYTITLSELGNISY